MRLLVFSDIHNDVHALERLMEIEADYYFAAGDMLTWARGAEKIGPVLARRAAKMYVIPGNHESDGDIDNLCWEFGLHPFHGRTMEIAGYHVAGLGYSNPTPFETPGEYSEQELADRLEPFAQLQPLIMICHCPPAGTALDLIKLGVHGGSQSILEFIERAQPRHFFCGHIHEAAGVEVEIGATQAINVGKRGYLLQL